MMNGKKYKVLYMDPPWHYIGNNIGARVPEKRANINPDQTGIYKTVPHAQMLEEFSPMISDLADPAGCAAFVWVTNKHWPEAVELMEAAGFKMVNVAFVWNKINRNMGVYTNPQCEYVALFTKGKPIKNLGRPLDARVKQYLEEKPTKHSRKPKEIQRRIEALWPDASRIELFARNRTTGWDSWGNELDKFEKQ